MPIKLSPEARRNKQNYDNEYAKKNFKSKLIPFNKLSPDDMELLDWINVQPEGGNQYVKRVCREDMIRRKQKQDV